MAATRAQLDAGIDMLGLSSDEKPVATMFGLPMHRAEALAYMAFQAGTHTEADAEILRAWVVKQALIEGMWAAEQLADVGLDPILGIRLTT
jgi:hypothetical protein